MGRRYKVISENVAVSAVQDLLQIAGAAGKTVKILRVAWKDTDTGGTLPTAQMIRTRCRYLPTVVTNGSGGSTPTPVKVDPGDAAASFTALANNTTQASTTGTAVVEAASGDYLYAGYDYTFLSPPVIGPSESFTFELLAAPSGTCHLTAEAEVEEIGG